VAALLEGGVSAVCRWVARITAVTHWQVCCNAVEHVITSVFIFCAFCYFVDFSSWRTKNSNNQVIFLDWITVFGNKHFWHWDVMCVYWLCWTVEDSQFTAHCSVLWAVSLAQLLQIIRYQCSAFCADIISSLDALFCIHSMFSCPLTTTSTFGLFVRFSFT
jgi:hypothetical protein